MKVLSVIQPWTTLLAVGEKKFESRSWRTTYRGPLAIHASKRIEKRICRQEPFISILARHGYTADTLPTGVILARCRLSQCFQVVENDGMSAMLDDGQVIRGQEFILGNYSVGRFAWSVGDMEWLDELIPAKGKLG